MIVYSQAFMKNNCLYCYNFANAAFHPLVPVIILHLLGTRLLDYSLQNYPVRDQQLNTGFAINYSLHYVIN